MFGHENYLYICEVPIDEVHYLINDDRTAAYGQPLGKEQDHTKPPIDLNF